MKILIVEDDPGKLRKIQEILKKYGLEEEYDVVTTGEDALRLEEQCKHELAILDIEFPWDEDEKKVVEHPGVEIMRVFDQQKSGIKVVVYSTIPVEEIWTNGGEPPPNCFYMQAVFPFQLEQIISKLPKD